MAAIIWNKFSDCFKNLHKYLIQEICSESAVVKNFLLKQFIQSGVADSQIDCNSIRTIVTLKFYDDFRNKQKRVWNNYFWYVKEYILKLYSLHYTLR